MKNLLVFCLIFFGICSSANGQEGDSWQYKNNEYVAAKLSRNTDDYKSGGYVNITVPANVDALVSKHRHVNQNNDKMDGWRIQLIQATDRNIVYTTRGRFTNMYNKTEVYLDYKQPYFKLRVGNFKTRMEAYKFLKAIRDDFDRAFLVQEEISKSKVY